MTLYFVQCAKDKYFKKYMYPFQLKFLIVGPIFAMLDLFNAWLIKQYALDWAIKTE